MSVQPDLGVRHHLRAPWGDVDDVILIAAASPQGVRDLLDAEPGASGPPGGPGGPEGAGPCRLAIAGPTAERLRLARKVVERASPWRGRQDVWFTDRPLLTDGKLALLFPGFEPEPAGSVDDISDHFGMPRLALNRRGWKDGGSGVMIDVSVDIVAMGCFLADALHRLGIEGDLLAGHSLGEWTAMIVAGMAQPTAFMACFAHVREGRAHLPDVAYAAAGCPADRAQQVLAGIAGVVLSHDNCPHQCVVCGPPAPIDQAAEALRAAGVQCSIMPFRSGFHTRMLEPSLELGRPAFARFPLRPPAYPVWSATLAGPYPRDPDEVRALVLRHLLEPVRFRELVEALYAGGVRAFVQVGSGSLTGFVEDTLGRRDHLAIAAQSARRSALGQLGRVLAALWVEGAAPNFGPLFGAQPARSVGRPHAEAPSGEPAPVAARHPVLAEFEAAVAEAAQAARAVLEAWAAAPTPHGEADPARPRGTEFSLAVTPALRDHCLYRLPPGWPDVADGFPVVPMTMLLDVMAAAAQAQFPGGVITGLSQVRALRWLAVAPPVTVPVPVSATPDGLAKVEIVGYAHGSAHGSARYPPAPPLQAWPLSGEFPPPVDARRLYSEGWMFHGPAYRGVAEITRIGTDGIQGILRAGPAPGALLDAAGQLVGHWAQVTATVDRIAFPTGIDSVRLYGPHPRPGLALACAVRIRSFTDEILRADFEVEGEDGGVWARVEGWTCSRLPTDEVTWPAIFLQPERNAVGERQPGGWCLVRDRWPSRASREYSMRRYLRAAERAEYEARAPRGQATWLLGRIAAKDAARHWLWEQGHGPMFPTELCVGNEEGGRPWVTAPGEPLSLSLAHTAGLGVALVRPAGSSMVGIDVEAVASVREAAGALSRIALSPSEQRLLAGRGAEAAWMTRFWTAKEAVAKAHGTGFAGRPADFVVVDASAEGLVVQAPTGREHRVHTRLVAGTAGGAPTHVVAWTADPRGQV